jgi:hypothetical protein
MISGCTLYFFQTIVSISNKEESIGGLLGKDIVGSLPTVSPLKGKRDDLVCYGKKWHA